MVPSHWSSEHQWMAISFASKSKSNWNPTGILLLSLKVLLCLLDIQPIRNMNKDEGYKKDETINKIMTKPLNWKIIFVRRQRFGICVLFFTCCLLKNNHFFIAGDKEWALLLKLQ